MKVEIFTLCDAATIDVGRKLNVLGSFDVLKSKEEPIVHAQCAVALKIRFERIEEGTKRLRIAFVDADGIPFMPAIDAETTVGFTQEEPTATATFVLNLQQLKLPHIGEYSIDLAVDGKHEASIPLFVSKMDIKGR